MSAEMSEWELRRSVDEFEFSVRTYNCLKNADIQTVQELMGKTERELLKLKSFGKKGVAEIREILQALGTDLKEENVYSLPRYTAQTKCPFCLRNITEKRTPEADIRLIVDDGGAVLCGVEGSSQMLGENVEGKYSEIRKKGK